MKKVFAIMLVLAMICCLGACGGGEEEAAPETETPAESTGRTVAEIQESGQLIMYTNAEFAPFEYRDDNNEIVGVDVDVAKEVAKDLGVELVIEDVAFDSVVTSIVSGKGDIAVAALTIKPERLESVDFSMLYTTSCQWIITPEGVEITDITSLEGMNVGVQTGTTGDFTISDAIDDGTIPTAQVQRYSSPVLAAQDIQTGRLDAVVVDELVAKNIVAANDGLTTVKLVYADGSDTEESYAIAITKGNTELADAINATLQRLIDDGSIDKFVETHTIGGTVE